MSYLHLNPSSNRYIICICIHCTYYTSLRSDSPPRLLPIFWLVFVALSPLKPKLQVSAKRNSIESPEKCPVENWCSQQHLPRIHLHDSIPVQIHAKALLPSLSTTPCADRRGTGHRLHFPSSNTTWVQRTSTRMRELPHDSKKNHHLSRAASVLTQHDFQMEVWIRNLQKGHG